MAIGSDSGHAGRPRTAAGRVSERDDRRSRRARSQQESADATSRSGPTASPLPASRAVGRRRERRVRRRVPERLDEDRAAPGVQDRHRRVDRRADGALRVPRAATYDDALREFYTTTASRNIFRMLSIMPAAAGRRVARGHRRRCGRDRAARRRGVPAADRARASARPAALHRDGRPRLAALHRLEHGAHRGERQPGGGRAVPQASCWRRRRSRSRFRRCSSTSRPGGRRYDEMHVDGAVGRERVLHRRRVQLLPRRAAGTGRGTGREDIFVIHNGQLLAGAGSDGAVAAQHRDARVRVGGQGRRRVGRPVPHLGNGAAEHGAGIHWITIPEASSCPATRLFDPVKMRALYELGFQRRAGRAGVVDATRRACRSRVRPERLRAALRAGALHRQRAGHEPVQRDHGRDGHRRRTRRFRHRREHRSRPCSPPRHREQHACPARRAAPTAAGT